MRDRAQTVIIGAGIVGVSAAYHLTELGVTDVLVLDQGPLFETGGSTSHAPGIIFQTNGSRTMCRIAQDSVALYDSLDLDGERCWYGVGGLEVATTPERMRGAEATPGLRARPTGSRAPSCWHRPRPPRRSRSWTPRRSWAPTGCRATAPARRVQIVTALAREGTRRAASGSRAA